MADRQRTDRHAYVPAAVEAAWAEWRAQAESVADERQVVAFYRRVGELLDWFDECNGWPRPWPPGVRATAKKLSPRLRDVLYGLLRGDGEKQIAHALRLSPHTVHEYVKLLYATFDVASRGELLAKFISPPPK